MKILNPETSLIEENNPLIKIEKVGRVCYKSDSEYTEETALKFFNNLKDRKHYGIFEHIRFIFEINPMDYYFFDECCKRSYFMCTEDFIDGKVRLLVSANLRALNEGRTVKNYTYGAVRKFIELISKRYTPEFDFAENYDSIFPKYPVTLYRDISEIPNATLQERLCHTEVSAHFITDRGISHEFVRHREFSFAQESTRYCNYSKDKHNREISVINPFIESQPTSVQFDAWRIVCEQSEKVYMQLTEDALTPQTVRSILPTCLKTELVMTGTLIMWQHFFDLRYYEKTGPAHPLAKLNATQAYDVMQNRYDIKSLNI